MTSADNSPQRLFILAASIAALLFVFITPPFKVPDEVGHFWRAVTIAEGAVVPPVDSRGGVAKVPVGLKTLVYVFLWQPSPPPPQTKIAWSQFRTAILKLPLESNKQVTVTFPAMYTPVAYAPQVMAALIGRATGARPAITFYLGRLFSAAAYILLIAWAIRIAPALRWLFCAAGLLPMALYMAASWSADSMVIGATFLFTALLLRACLSKGGFSGRELAALGVAAALVGLCKPAYVLFSLLAVAIPAARAGKGAALALIILGTIAGTSVSLWTQSRGAATPRSDQREAAQAGPRVDPRAQLECIQGDPLRFLRVMASDFRVRGAEYGRQCIGRLGMLEVQLPRPVIWGESLVLIIALFTSGGAVPGRVRAVAAAISVLTIAGIAVALYLGWTPVCAGTIEGIQGRYFLPLLPLLGVAFGIPLLRDQRVALVSTAVMSVVGTAAALFAVAMRYYS